MLGKNRKDGALRLITAPLFYLAFMFVMPFLLLLVIVWFAVDITLQITTNSEGLSDDGFIPGLYKKTKRTENNIFFGSNEDGWGRK